jgi:hypothetical protein
MTHGNEDILYGARYMESFIERNQSYTRYFLGRSTNKLT